MMLILVVMLILMMLILMVILILVVKFAGQMELAGKTMVIFILVMELAGKMDLACQTTVVTVMTRAVELFALLLHQGEIFFIGKRNSSGESGYSTNLIKLS